MPRAILPMGSDHEGRGRFSCLEVGWESPKNRWGEGPALLLYLEHKEGCCGSLLEQLREVRHHHLGPERDRWLTLLRAGGPTSTPPLGGTAGLPGQRAAPFQPVSLAVQH